jgi:predicted glycosyltransferase
LTKHQSDIGIPNGRLFPVSCDHIKSQGQRPEFGYSTCFDWHNMRFLFDISHPAHVHFFGAIVTKLKARGHAVSVVARDKEVTHSLLEARGIEYESFGRSGRKNIFAQTVELVVRDLALWRIAKRFGADVIVTRNPCGVQAARLCGAIGVFDTDDGRAAGIHFRLAAPFAHYITTPDCLVENYGTKHIRYKGYKQSAYLHPNIFTPDSTVVDQLELQPGEAFFIVRFVSMTAFHDSGEAGIPNRIKRDVIERLKNHGRVFISSEEALKGEYASLCFPLEPDRILHALAFARLYVGDSQTMAAEAAVLGTPSLRMSSFAGRLDYLSELEQKYKLVHSYTSAESAQFIAKLEELLSRPRDDALLAAGYKRMLDEKIDVAEWYSDFLASLGHPDE